MLKVGSLFIKIVSKLNIINNYSTLLTRRFMYRVTELEPTVTWESGFSQYSGTTNYFYAYGPFLYNNINASKSANFSTGSQTTLVATVNLASDWFDRVDTIYANNATSAPYGALKKVRLQGESGSSKPYSTRIYQVRTVDVADKNVSFRQWNPMLFKSLFE